jgi:TonB family protein
MNATQISIERLLDLNVPVSWREATAVLCEAVSLVRRAGGSSPERPPLTSCLVTRGGAVVLDGQAAGVRPDVLVTLARDLLKTCRAPDRLGEAMAAGSVLDFVDEFTRRTSSNTRRVEIASLALRALAAEADVAMSRSVEGAGEANDPVRAAAPARPWSRIAAGESGAAQGRVPFERSASVGRERRFPVWTAGLVILSVAAAIGSWQRWRTIGTPSPPIVPQGAAAPVAPSVRNTVPALPVGVDSAERSAEVPLADSSGPRADPAASPRVPKAVAPSEVTSRSFAPLTPLARPSDGAIDDPIFPSPSAGVEPPRLLSRVRPGTVGLAVNQPVAGVTIEVLVDRSGRVEDARLASSGGASRERQAAALAAARHWQFTPARWNGQAVRSTTRLVVAP